MIIIRTLANYIFFVAMSAIIMSFIFLMPVFMICGPQGEQGDLRVLSWGVFLVNPDIPHDRLDIALAVGTGTGAGTGVLSS